LRRRTVLKGFGGLGLGVLLPWPALAQEAASGAPVAPAGPQPGIAMHGDLKYPPGFDHFDYVVPDAPKGGLIRLGNQGTYDSFNPYIIRGTPADGLGFTIETLMISADDEPFSEYGLLARTVETPPDRSWVVFRLNPDARWHDGTPVTSEDVVFTLDLLKTKGHPFYRHYYANIVENEALDRLTVRFGFMQGENRELPLICGQIPVLPKHWWESRDFDGAILEPPLGSGPYRIGAFEPGRFIEYERVPDYWGWGLNVMRGQFNFDRIRYEYFLDETVIREALKAGALDFRQENQAKAWALDYNVPAVREGRLIKEQIGHERPTGLQGFVMNTRRPLFQDRRVREALGYAFDFEWTNRNLFFSAYSRTRSYFSNSDLASRGLPEGRELEILEAYRDRVPEEVFTQPFEPPSTDGSGWPRENLRKAFALLKEAGWVVRDLRLVNEQTGEPFAFEILLSSPTFERIALPFVFNLRRLGMEPTVRTVDISQYINRVRSFDFDMIVAVWGQSDSPGNEQRDFWSSAAARQPGTRNYAGIQDPVVDELIDKLIAAPTRAELVARTRALDRVLLWGYYVIPQWHARFDRVIYWDKYDHPAASTQNGLDLNTWWFDRAKAERLRQGVQPGQES